jgi:hypothetical protein
LLPLSSAFGIVRGTLMNPTSFSLIPYVIRLNIISSLPTESVNPHGGLPRVLSTSSPTSMLVLLSSRRPPQKDQGDEWESKRHVVLHRYR